MRTLDHVDLLVICAEAMPVREGFDLLRWWLSVPSEDYHDIKHPSVDWWVRKHARGLQPLLAEEYRNARCK